MRCGKVVDGVIVNAIAADSVEWCSEHLDGEWVELPEHIGIGMPKDAPPPPSTPAECFLTEFYSENIYRAKDRNTRMFMLNPIAYYEDIDTWQPKFPIDLTTICSSDSFFTLPLSLVKNDTMSDFDRHYYENLLDIVTHHEVLFKGDDWAICLTCVKPEEWLPLWEVTDPPLHAPSMQELARLIFEWDWAYEYGNRETAAVICHNAVNTLGLNQIKASIIDTVPPMQIVDFLEGRTYTPAPSDPPIIPLPEVAKVAAFKK